MTDQPLYPLRFEPIFQYRLWGGRRLGDWLDRPLPEGPIGEAWVLSDRADHASRVADGPLQGATLTELIVRSKAKIMGERGRHLDRFPVLLKFLDVSQMLSVQVHPRDDQTDLIPVGDTGKTEAWVVLQAEVNSRIYAGLKPSTTAQDLRHLSQKNVDDHLARFSPRIGQGLLIDAGTVHSLGDGVMVFEVQENSDVTFRLYDWDHVDAKTGKPRNLQVDQALACIDLDQGPIAPVTPVLEASQPVRRERYFDNPHFRLWRLHADIPFTVGAAAEPRVIVCIDGGGTIAYGGLEYPAERGAVTLLPAVVGACRFTPDGNTTVLEIAVTELT